MTERPDGNDALGVLLWASKRQLNRERKLKCLVIEPTEMSSYRTYRIGKYLLLIKTDRNSSEPVFIKAAIQRWAAGHRN